MELHPELPFDDDEYYDVDKLPPHPPLTAEAKQQIVEILGNSGAHEELLNTFIESVNGHEIRGYPMLIIIRAIKQQVRAGNESAQAFLNTYEGPYRLPPHLPLDIDE